MPINEPNPSSSYSIDVGDVISIQLIGQNNNNDNYLINRRWINYFSQILERLYWLD